MKRSKKIKPSPYFHQCSDILQLNTVASLDELVYVNYLRNLYSVRGNLNGVLRLFGENNFTDIPNFEIDIYKDFLSISELRFEYGTNCEGMDFHNNVLAVIDGKLYRFTGFSNSYLRWAFHWDERQQSCGIEYIEVSKVPVSANKDYYKYANYG